MDISLHQSESDIEVTTVGGVYKEYKEGPGCGDVNELLVVGADSNSDVLCIEEQV